LIGRGSFFVDCSFTLWIELETGVIGGRPVVAIIAVFNDSRERIFAPSDPLDGKESYTP
jgi:hypothetical protein